MPEQRSAPWTHPSGRYRVGHPDSIPVADRTPVLWIMCGPPGAGKSTFVRGQLTPRVPNLARVCPDEIRREFTGDEHDMRADDRVWAETYARLRSALTQDRSAVLDATTVRADHLGTAVAIARRADVPAVGVLLLPDSFTTGARNASRPRPVPDEVVDDMWTATWRVAPLLLAQCDLVYAPFPPGRGDAVTLDELFAPYRVDLTPGAALEARRLLDQLVATVPPSQIWIDPVTLSLWFTRPEHCEALLSRALDQPGRSAALLVAELLRDMRMKVPGRGLDSVPWVRFPTSWP